MKDVSHSEESVRDVYDGSRECEEVSESKSSSFVGSEAYRDGNTRERGGSRGGDGSRDDADDWRLGGGVGRYDALNGVAKKSAVADRTEVPKSGLGVSVLSNTRVLTFLLVGFGGGVSTEGAFEVNGEAKKAAVLLLPLEDGSMGEGNGDGKENFEADEEGV